jgi:hypothetical protein
MIVEDFAEIGRRLRARQGAIYVMPSDAPVDDCPLPSERNSEYRNCRRQCGRIVHGVMRTCDGSCHVA